MTEEKINILKLMGCKLFSRAVGDNIYYSIAYTEPNGRECQTMLHLREHEAWREAAEFILSDRSSRLRTMVRTPT